jgi:hypothetical protein
MNKIVVCGINAWSPHLSPRILLYFCSINSTCQAHAPHKPPYVCLWQTPISAKQFRSGSIFFYFFWWEDRTVADNEQEKWDDRRERGGMMGGTRRDNGQGRRDDGWDEAGWWVAEVGWWAGEAWERQDDGWGHGSLLTQAGIFHKKMFIPQTSLKLICGISLVCKNNGPITQIYIFTNGKICPTVNSPNTGELPTTMRYRYYY